jgi:vanillate O-demethylase monooxygenase subunit
LLNEVVAGKGWVDCEHPALGRAWYAVALSRDVGDRPVPVEVLGRRHQVQWVDGSVQASDDLRVTERYGLVWAAPDEPVSDLPAFPEWDDPTFDRCWNEPRSTTADALQLTDNFLDATHLPTVHTATFGVDDGGYLPPHEVVRDGWRAATTYVTPYRNHDDPLVATGEHPLVQEHHLTKEVVPATTALVRLRFPMTGGVLAILFSCLPEGPGRSRIFKVMARNDLGGDADRLADSLVFEDRVLDEDLAVLEAYRHRGVPVDPRVEIHTRSDKLSLAYRRILADLTGSGVPA